MVFTESWTHEILTMQTPGTSGDRGDIPAGEDAENVVSMMTFSHAGGAVGKVTTTSTPAGFAGLGKRNTREYTNCANCHNATATAKAAPLAMNFNTPESPWWKWPVVAISLGITGFVLFQFWPVVVMVIRFFARRIEK